MTLYILRREFETPLGIIIQTLNENGEWCIATSKPKIYSKKFSTIGMDSVGKCFFVHILYKD